MSSINESDIAAVAAKIETEILPQVAGTEASTDYGYNEATAVAVIDCVLSLNRKYDAFVVPRLETFTKRHPEIQKVGELAELIDSYPTPLDFSIEELNYRDENRARILREVVQFVCTIVQEVPAVSEEEVLKEWALRAKPHECETLGIRGFKVAGFQYLRILFGADTTKPDVHIIGFIADALNRRVSAYEALDLLEAAAPRLGLSVRAVDAAIWRSRARPTSELHEEEGANGDQEKLVRDFLVAAELAGIEIQRGDICAEILPMPHTPPTRLPKGKMAVYVFATEDCVLKVGQAGKNSSARYANHHYNPDSSCSNLAKSLLKDEEAVQEHGFNAEQVGDWIKENTNRWNFLMDADFGKPVLTLLEAFVQCRLRPRYEGFASQR